MPDLSSNKLSAKSAAVKKTQSTGGSAKPPVSSKGRESKRSGGDRSNSHSPPRRRRPRPRSRSSSHSRSSGSSSSGSDSAHSSDSHSTHSGKEPPKKTSRTTVTSEPKVERPKPTKRTGDLPSKDVASKSAEPKATRESKRQQPNTNVDTGKDSSIRVENSSKAHATDATSTHIPTSKSATEKSPVSESVNKDTSAKVSSKPSKESEIDRTVKNQGDVPCDLPKFTCVLVEKLTRNVNKAHVTEIFSVWGEIEHVDMPSDRLHPEFSRSYAYVHYHQSKSAMDAVNYMNGGQIDGEIVRVTEVLSKSTLSSDSRNAVGGKPQGQAVTEDRSHARDRDRETVKTRDTDKPSTISTRPKDEHAPLPRRPEDSSNNDRQREHKPSRDDDRETGFDRRRDARMRERERDRLRDRERERRERERERDRDRDRDRSRLTGAPRRARRGSSGSPFASRSGGPAGERQRSPAAGGARYRRPSPPTSTRADRSPARRGRSRTPPGKSGPSRSGAAGTGGGNSVAEDKTASGRRGRRATSRSSSSSSSDSSSSSSSSSSSASSGTRSGSASSSSSSTSRSRS